MLEKIVGGAQTGADRGALDAALARGFPVGGWVPKGRRAEDGEIPARYMDAGLVEHSKTNHIARIEQNVIDSDATLILSFTVEGATTGETGRTAEFAKKHEKPCRVCLVSAKDIDPEQLSGAIQFVREHDPKVLNVGGPRERKQPGLQAAAERFVSALLQMLSMFCLCRFVARE